MEAAPNPLVDEAGDNLDPDKIWATMMKNEKPGGHGERSVAVGTIDMAVWDTRPRSRGSRRFGCWGKVRERKPDPRVFVYAAGGYYYAGKGLLKQCDEMQSYIDGLPVVKMKIGNGRWEKRQPRIEAVR